MDKYTYLLIPLFLFLPWIWIFASDKSRRRKLVRLSVVGGFAGFIAEYWYFKDYWQPTSLFGASVISIEDFLFGFTITGIAATAYDAVFPSKPIQNHKKRKKFFGILFLTGVAFMMVFNILMGVNSILVSSFAFLIFAGIMISLRPDLLRPCLLSGVLSVVIIIPFYAIIFNLISPDYWEKHWLLQGTELGIYVFGHIPATELLWYFCWGCMAGISHDFATGRSRVLKTNDTTEAAAAAAS